LTDSFFFLEQLNKHMVGQFFLSNKNIMVARISLKGTGIAPL